MKANMLDYMYEGYGYDMDNQLLYTDVEKYNEALTSGSSMSTNGMETLAHQGIISHDQQFQLRKITSTLRLFHLSQRVVLSILTLEKVSAVVDVRLVLARL